MTKKKTNLGLAIVLTIFGSGIGIGAWWFWAIAAPTTEDIKIKAEIAIGESTQEISSKLENLGVIRSRFALRIWLKYQELKGNSTALRAGVYQFSSNQALPEVVDKMQNLVPAEVIFTIPEGWAIAQMAEYFEEKGFFSKADFVQATRTNLDRKPWLPAKISGLEGYLFPDTYQIPREQVTPDRLIDMMLNRFEQVALPLAPTSLSLNKWVAFASIVEKEAVLDQERSIIAGVFWARLKRGMRLESDPTVEYGLNIKQTVDRPLTLKQVRTPSPYNTYLNQGLPPSAIASPGLKSLKAVLNPTKSDYLFFVARYDGSHIFSRTYTEHQAAIQIISKQLKIGN